MAFQKQDPCMQVLGTSSYYSGFHYLGYNPYGGGTNGLVEVKSEMDYWVSFKRVFFVFQLKYSSNPLGLFQTVRLCLEKEMQIVKEVTKWNLDFTFLPFPKNLR